MGPQREWLRARPTRYPHKVVLTSWDRGMKENKQRIQSRPETHQGWSAFRSLRSRAIIITPQHARFLYTPLLR